MLRHGTVSGYNHYKCRCERCSAFHSLYMNGRRKEHDAPPPEDHFSAWSRQRMEAVALRTQQIVNPTHDSMGVDAPKEDTRQT